MSLTQPVNNTFMSRPLEVLHMFREGVVAWRSGKVGTTSHNVLLLISI
jgi:hypothetical protein